MANVKPTAIEESYVKAEDIKRGALVFHHVHGLGKVISVDRKKVATVKFDDRSINRGDLIAGKGVNRSTIIPSSGLVVKIPVSKMDHGPWLSATPAKRIFGETPLSSIRNVEGIDFTKTKPLMTGSQFNSQISKSIFDTATSAFEQSSKFLDYIILNEIGAIYRISTSKDRNSFTSRLRGSSNATIGTLKTIDLIDNPLEDQELINVVYQSLAGNKKDTLVRLVLNTSYILALLEGITLDDASRKIIEAFGYRSSALLKGYTEKHQEVLDKLKKLIVEYAVDASPEARDAGK